MKEQFKFSITADQDDGLLSRIILLFTRRKINIDRLQFQATGTSCELACHLQCMMYPEKATNLLKQIQNVIGVKSVVVSHHKPTLQTGPKQLSEYNSTLSF